MFAESGEDASNLGENRIYDIDSARDVIPDDLPS